MCGCVRTAVQKELKVFDQRDAMIAFRLNWSSHGLALSQRPLPQGSDCWVRVQQPVSSGHFLILKVTLKVNPLLMIASNSVSCYIIIITALLMARHHAPCCLQQRLNYEDWTQTGTESVSVCQRLLVGLAGRQDRVSGNVLKHKSQKMLDAKFCSRAKTSQNPHACVEAMVFSSSRMLSCTFNS